MNNRLYQEALDVAGSYDIATPKNSVVLYSISYLPTTENRDKAFAYVKSHPKSCMIEDTVCGKKLVELGVGYHEVGLSPDEVAHIWAVASRRFINGVKGKVTAFVDKADVRSVFRTVELPMLLDNPAVTKINNMDKYQFAEQFK
ncbi:MAG: hypothetical protein IJ660_03235 [Alphaproteobacteria bacterium]|nr:hypothetical protein [Alphaproteobacteria bacterium]